jgi:hypothetical protein
MIVETDMEVILWIVLWLGNNAWLGKIHLLHKGKLNGEQLFWKLQYVAQRGPDGVYGGIWLNGGVNILMSERHVLCQMVFRDKSFIIPSKI